jgi:hypothetical protein
MGTNDFEADFLPMPGNVVRDMSSMRYWPSRRAFLLQLAPLVRCALLHFGLCTRPYANQKLHCLVHIALPRMAVTGTGTGL